MHMRRRIWRVRSYSETEARTIADALSISYLTATVLSARGFGQVGDARVWISEVLDHDPFRIPDMDRAVERLDRAIRDREPICCYGDYDVDGISATSMYFLFLRRHGAKVSIYIPDRQTEGYGLNDSAIRKLAEQGAKVLLTADCGTTSYRETALAERLGMDVIVTDHHQVRESFPTAVAFLNPHRPDSRYPFPFLCTGGLAYKVVKALAQEKGLLRSDSETFCDLAALATIADAVPLQDENRTIVRQGLERLQTHPRPGVMAITERLGMKESWTASTVAFQLAPLINASGRLAHGQLGVELLTCESVDAGRRIAEELFQLNQQRKALEQQIVEEALTQAGQYEQHEALVVGARGWHVGVVGIVAARLVEREHRPAVVVAFDAQGNGRGSVRSIEGVDVCLALQRCADLLDGFGGHAAAAGFQLQEARLPAFRERFSQAIEEQARIQGGEPMLVVDARAHLRSMHPRLVRELETLAPFGVGNPEPTFLANAVEVLEHRVVGDGHLKVLVRQPQSGPVSAIGFRLGWMADAGVLSHRRVDMAFVPEVKRWNGLDRIQLRISDLRPNEAKGRSGWF